MCISTRTHAHARTPRVRMREHTLTRTRARAHTHTHPHTHTGIPGHAKHVLKIVPETREVTTIGGPFPGKYKVGNKILTLTVVY